MNTGEPSYAESSGIGERPERVTPVAVCVLLGVAFLLALVSFFALGLHAHPAKDDYLSAMMFQGLDVAESLRLQYRLHNGRLVSALLMRFSPVQFGSLEGYKLACIGFVLTFAGSLVLYLNWLLRERLHPLDRAAVFFSVFLCLQAALGNVAEFYYWLPAISCYGTAALLFLLLLRLLPAALRASGGSRIVHVPAAMLTVFGISLCAEPGAIMSAAAVVIFALHERRHARLSVWAFAATAIALAAGFMLAACSPGNALRMATSAHERSVLQTLAGGAYALCGDLLRLGFAVIPALVFFGVIVWRRDPDAFILVRRFAVSLLLIAGFALAAELVAFYGLGGMPALRVRNSIVCMCLLLLPGVAMQAIVKRPAERTIRKEPGRLLLLAMGVWVSLGIFIPGNPVCSAMQDLASGTARRYDVDMKAVYASASTHIKTDSFLKVAPVRTIPASLFVAQPLILKEEMNGWPWLNVQMAAYFGFRRIYTDSLAQTPSSDVAFQSWLRNRRAATF